MSISNQWPKIFRFTLQDHFVPSSAKDKFVLSLAAITNDLVLVHRIWCGEDDEGSKFVLTDEERFFMFRLAMTQVWESCRLMSVGAKHADVVEMLAALPEPAQEALVKYNGFRETIDANEDYRTMLASCRNLTAHYPGPDDKNFVRAITDLGSTEQSLTARDGTTSGIRYNFADAVLFRAAFGRAEDDQGFRAFIHDVALPAVRPLMTLGYHVVDEHMKGVLQPQQGMGGEPPAS